MRLPGSIVVSLVCCVLTLAQQSMPIYHGSWMATAGTQTFRGRWTGESLPRRPNAARGTWQLENDSGAVLMHGRWSAERQSDGWRGSFIARTGGRVVSGTWKADVGEATAKSLADMLERSMEKEVSGLWASRGRFGEWWLSAP